jgi:predicted TPR repeat methyltransferase
MTDREPQSDAPAAPPEVMAASAHVDAAKRLAQEGERAAALRECGEALRHRRMTPGDALAVVLILRHLGERDAAAQVERQVRAQLDGAAGRVGADADALVQLARFYLMLEAETEAEPVLRRAIAADPTDTAPLMMLSRILVTRGDADAAAAMWPPHLEVAPSAGAVALQAAKLFALFGRRDHAEALLRIAEPLPRDNLNEFRHVAAGIRGEEAALDQSGHAVEVFDRFSESYDAVLTKIGNAGPRLVGRVLEELGLPRDGSRRVLDAGCGTGLCAPVVRPHARLLHGIDVSVGMLNKAREKGTYDLLSRTDLGVDETYPEGRFDLVVSSDVLVYFGDLAPVLRNIARRLDPGGWMVLSVEDAGTRAGTRGWMIHASGRYQHQRDYLERTLVACGFTAPRVVLSERLRYEFGEPVPGLAIAAQRLAVAAG